MSSAYVVRGSEDGTIAVYGSARNACLRAAKYVFQEDSADIASMVQNIRRHGYADLSDNESGCSVEVQHFYIE